MVILLAPFVLIRKIFISVQLSKPKPWVPGVDFGAEIENHLTVIYSVFENLTFKQN